MIDFDKIWYISSGVILSYRNVNVFRLTWVVYLRYLEKLSICVLQSEQQLELWTKNRPTNALDRPTDVWTQESTDRQTHRSFTGKFDRYKPLRYENDAA